MIQGERILLRAVTREDLPRFVEWLNDPVVLEFFGPLPPFSLAQEERWFADMQQDSSQRSFSIECERQHIGGAGFSSIDGRNRNAEVGIFIGKPELWDRGLGRDVMVALLRFGFEQLNLHRIYLRVFAENDRAVHLYESIGFQQEGCWRQGEYRHDRYHDILWMSILREEWKA